MTPLALKSPRKARGKRLDKDQRRALYKKRAKVVVFFGILDSYYLREERLFRYLYDDARRGLIEVYSMKKNDYRVRCTRRSVLCSWSVFGFYGPLLLVGLGALVWAVFMCPT